MINVKRLPNQKLFHDFNNILILLKLKQSVYTVFLIYLQGLLYKMTTGDET